MRLVALLCALLCLPSFGANLIHNGSFEVGPSGWSAYGSFSATDYGDEQWLANRIVSTNATHGAHSVINRTRLISRPFEMTNYPLATMTFKARASIAMNMSAGILPIEFVTITPAATHSITTSWASYTNSTSISSNWSYCVKFYTGDNPEAQYWIDEVQVEYGTATPFETLQQIEVGMDTADANNSLFLSDAKTLRFQFWNNGPLTNVTVPYKISNLWNSNVTSGAISTNALRANTNTTINLALPALWGYLRPYCYVTNLDRTWSETSVSTYPYAAGSGKDTNGILGIHSQFGEPSLAHARRLGFSYTRVLSPIRLARWVQQFPTLTTTNIYPVGSGIWLSDYVYQYIGSNGLIPFTSLTGEDGEWYPQTNASLTVMINDYLDTYVTKMVDRFRATNWIWEIWNEPQQNPRSTVALYNPAIYANLYTNAARRIKLTDPTAKVVAFGGYSSAGEALTAWNLFTPQGQADADYVSFHNYPNDATANPNLPNDDNAFSTANVGEIARTFKPIGKPIWNTETAARDAGGQHGQNVMFAYPFRNGGYDPSVWGSSVAWYGELNGRTVTTAERSLYVFLRNIGWGYKQVNIQFQRMVDENIYNANSPTIYELNDSVKPWSTALLIAASFMQNSGIDRLTNSFLPGINATNYYFEAYVVTNSRGTVMPVFACDRTNRIMWPTNGHFALYDVMGNLICTNTTNILITRTPQYVVSGDLTTVQLSNTFKFAPIFKAPADLTPPGITIDVSPIGNTPIGPGYTNTFTWTGIEDDRQPWANALDQTAATNILYRYSFDNGGSWSNWSGSNFTKAVFPDNTTRWIKVQAKNFVNLTAEDTGPAFGNLTVPPVPPGGSTEPTAPRIRGLRVTP